MGVYGRDLCCVGDHVGELRVLDIKYKAKCFSPCSLALTATGYAVSILVPATIYFLLYVVALCWILYADWHR